MKFLLFLLIEVAIFCDFISCNGHFTVVGPKLIKQNGKYEVAITSRNFNEPDATILEVGIQNFHNVWRIAKNITLTNGKSQSLEFDMEGQPFDDYYLTVTGADFNGKVNLEMNIKNFSVFVQTDKAIYKPSDVVQFRVLVLNEKLLPLNSIKAQIIITDGAQNRIKQFDDIVLIKGVFEGTFKLSDLPILGNWNIVVLVNNKKEVEKVFEVAEYTLPNFEVSLDVNPHANYDEQKISATVVAKHTFGKIAKGNATVTAEVQHNKVSKSMEVDGKKSVEFDMEKDLGIIRRKHSEETVKLFVTFEEQLTGRVQNATSIVQIHITPHKIKLLKDSQKFKPGLPFTVRAIVQYHDQNVPVTDNVNPVKFTKKFHYEVTKTCEHPIYPIGRSYPYWNQNLNEGWNQNLNENWNQGWNQNLNQNWNQGWNQGWNQNFNFGLNRNWNQNGNRHYDCSEKLSYEEVSEIYPSNGIAEISAEIPDKITRLDVVAKYLQTEQSIRDIKKAQSDSNQFIKIKSTTDKPKFTEKIKIEVLSTTDITDISYHALNSNGVVVASDTLQISPTKSHDFEFMPNYDMIPKIKIIVFYITGNGEIISDSLEIEFNNELRNFIDIKVPSSPVKPGEMIDISITSNANSFVGLLGVDQSVMVLKKGNDIEESSVFEELKEYRKAEKTKNSQSTYSWTRSKSYLDFEASNTVIITNAKREYVPPPKRRLILSASSSPVHIQNFARLMPPSPDYSISAQTLSSYSVNSAPRIQAYEPVVRVEEEVEEEVENETPYANQASVTQIEPIELRKSFPETWLFESLNFGLNESNTVVSRKVPDTITSWIITGFSVDPVTGFGLTKQPTKFNVFQPFFVSMNLPYSIKRGEIVSIPISVFNYMEEDQETEITLYNEDSEFEFIEVKGGDANKRRHRKSTTDNLETKNLVVKSQSGISTAFIIRSLKIGLIKIKVVVRSPIAEDGAERFLVVKPEGITQYFNKAVFIDLRDSDTFTKGVNVDIPLDIVPDSSKIEASATADILGPSIENLDKLIKLPYGCGEQNMLNFVPNIVVLDYLTAVKKLTPEIMSKAKTFLETGYQRELTYKHDDGSYSVWGKGDKSGSTWLTAFVAKSFRQAAKYILVDANIIEKALSFLSQTQAEDGSFSEVGYIFQKNIQGGSSKGVGLTAYTLITFLENRDFVETSYKVTIEKALAFLTQNYNNITDTYSLAITTYALQLADHSLKSTLLSMLETKAITESGVVHWEKDRSESAKTTSNYEVSSVDIEITAYALQAFVEAGRLADSIRIMKWLVSQRNENGGFISTQDTVVGLQALAKVAANMYAANTNMNITIKYNGSESSMLYVNERNSLILQKYELPSSVRDYEVTANGKGFSIFQVSYQYNIATRTEETYRFNISPVVMPTSNKNFLHLKVCTSYIPSESNEISNMAVMEVTFPSGLTFDTDFLPELKSTKAVKKVEIKDRKTVVVVYFDDLSEATVCPEFVAVRTHSVAMLKPASIVVYDYYDNKRHALSFYNLPETSMCDVCDDDDDECLRECEEMINAV